MIPLGMMELLCFAQLQYKRLRINNLKFIMSILESIHQSYSTVSDSYTISLTNSSYTGSNFSKSSSDTITDFDSLPSFKKNKKKILRRTTSSSLFSVNKFEGIIFTGNSQKDEIIIKESRSLNKCASCSLDLNDCVIYFYKDTCYCRNCSPWRKISKIPKCPIPTPHQKNSHQSISVME